MRLTTHVDLLKGSKVAFQELKVLPLKPKVGTSYDSGCSLCGQQEGSCGLVGNKGP